MKNFYGCLKKIYSPTSSGSSPLLSADGTKLMAGKNKILERWVEHFDGVLNRPSFINNKGIEQLPQAPVNEILDITPTLGEVQIAICQLSCGKAPGSDSIPAEIYKKGGPALTGKLLTLIQLIWVREQLPQDFKKANVRYTTTSPTTKEIIVARDASLYGIGAWIMHKLNDSLIKPITYASMTLLPTEKNYSGIEKVNFGIVVVQKKFHKRRFILQTGLQTIACYFGAQKRTTDPYS